MIFEIAYRLALREVLAVRELLFFWRKHRKQARIRQRFLKL